MKIRTRILLSYFVLISAVLYFFIDWVAKQLTPRYMESVEESLVDTSRFIATFIESLDQDKLPLTSLKNSFQNIYSEKFEAEIYNLHKESVDLRIFITDNKGIVLFDSYKGMEEGKDYSKWNDIYLTLHGKYGARSSLLNPADPDSSALFVAAPVKLNGTIQGVVSVCKPKKNIRKFIALAKNKIILTGIFAGLSILLLGFFVSLWITYPIKRLLAYIQSVKTGDKVQHPDLGKNELGTLSQALNEMRESLEGKNYIENYVLSLTHELKSPISAIRGSAELLKEELPADKRGHFLGHILNEVERLKQIIERLLLLSSLEKKQEIKNPEEFHAEKILEEIKTSLANSINAKKISLKTEADNNLLLHGERFLIYHALQNLLQNAIDFSPPGSEILIRAFREGEHVTFIIKDHGTGIPDYAMPHIFNKFY